MYEHTTNGLNKMSYEDIYWEVHHEMEELKLQKQFDAQLKLMETQDHHRYKDTRDKWAYASEKVKKQNK